MDNYTSLHISQYNRQDLKKFLLFLYFKEKNQQKKKKDWLKTKVNLKSRRKQRRRTDLYLLLKY